MTDKQITIAKAMDDSLYIGMTREQTIEVMGEPGGTSKYVSSYDDGSEESSETLEYDKGNTSIHLCNNRVKGWSIYTGTSVMKTNFVKFASMDEDKRLVYGIVMEPDSIDTDGEYSEPAAIEEAAHKFLSDCRTMGDSHTKQAKAVPVESYIAPIELTIGEQVVKQGSWVMTSRVDDDELWEGIKKGDYTGYSIGAYVKRVEIPDEPVPEE